jgi:catechol 2,3-dioxygenase-like lactoylglutathione lyase family enzyme
MSAFTHIVLGTNDIEQAKQFYDAILTPLGMTRLPDFSPATIMYATDKPCLMITLPRNGEPATFANGGTVGLVAPSREAVDAFHAAALANGGSCEGEPGPRDTAGPDAYGAYVRDPVGNKLCAFSGLNR